MIKHKANPSKRFAFTFTTPTHTTNCIFKKLPSALLPDLHAARYTEISGYGKKIVRKIIE